MKQKEPFTLYPRKNKSGKNVFYYRIYDENGIRTAGKSTGQTSKTAARNYVTDLIRNNQLTVEKDISFEVYAKDWWIWGRCGYIKMKRAGEQRISRSHTKIQRGNLKKHILPFFKSVKLRNINTKLIEKWLLSLHDTGKLSGITINHNLATLKVMLKEARRLGYIISDPTIDVSQYAEHPVKKGILSLEQVKNLFKEDNIQLLWNGNITHYTL
ncbi:MAG: phage integrase SAM-like domain-containing protein, partial [Spirochaetaceae bacterium]|nr:phage integrase SAM-like domain-containing protein [Spirochaetaceae bacterium]